MSPKLLRAEQLRQCVVGNQGVGSLCLTSHDLCKSKTPLPPPQQQQQRGDAWLVELVAESQVC